MERNVTDFALYRFRYVIGYLVLFAAVGGLLVFAGLYAPGGIRPEEVDAAVASSSLSFLEFSATTVVNLPYHLLQRLSLVIFGVSIFSIKLPSIMLGIAAIMGAYLLVREWFKNNIAIITTLLAATMPMFLFMAQDGTPSIYAAAISIWLLYAATLVSRRRAPTLFWKILLFALIALNLYTPLGLYLVVALATIIIFHPHVRHTIKQLKASRLVTAGSMVVVLLIPLLYSLSVQPSVGLSLLGIPSETPNFVANAGAVASSLFNFAGGSADGVMHPMISLGLTIVMIIGMYRFVQIRYTARSYIIWLWAIILLPFIILQPSNLTYLYPLIVIMIAMGISSIITTWYRTFPKNPYARVVGLIPLSVIVIGISMSGVNRYALSYTYDPELTQSFSQDIRLFSRVKQELAQDTTTVIISRDELKLYKLYEQFDDSITVRQSAPATIETPLVVSSAAHDQLNIPGKITTITTNSHKTDADRFYVYTPLEK